jgi:hypothetical protein
MRIEPREWCKPCMGNYKIYLKNLKGREDYGDSGLDAEYY